MNGSSDTGTASSSCNTPTYNAYPLSRLADLKKQYKNVKTIHMIRHAQGTHNVNDEYKDEVHLDARLTDLGVAQCQVVADDMHTSSLNPAAYADLIVTSTLTRCIQTALYCFPTLVAAKGENNNIPIVAHEDIRETVNFAADRRRPLSHISAEYPQVDFSDTEHEHDKLWYAYNERLGLDWDSIRESAELHKVAERGRSFWKYLAKRSEEKVIVCTHSAFLRCTLSWGQEGGVQWMPPQTLDDRHHTSKNKNKSGVNDDSSSAALPPDDVPLLNYNGDKAFEDYVRKEYANCELRSFCVVFE